MPWFSSCSEGHPFRNISEIPVLSEPLYLGLCVTVDNIALLVLESPGNNDKDIAFPDPDLLLDLALDPPDARHTIETADLDVVCTKHQFSAAKDLTVPLVRQAHTYDLLPGIPFSAGHGFTLRRICQFTTPNAFPESLLLSITSLYNCWFIKYSPFREGGCTRTAPSAHCTRDDPEPHPLMLMSIGTLT